MSKTMNFPSETEAVTADDLEMGHLSETELDDITKTVETEIGDGETSEDLTCREMRALFERPIPKRLVKSMNSGGRSLKYLHWVVVAKLLAHFSPKSTGRVVNILSNEFGITVTYEIMVPCKDGTLFSSNVGYKEHTYANGKPMGFGGASLAAQRQAMKRAAADLGIGRGFYEGAG